MPPWGSGWDMLGQASPTLTGSDRIFTYGGALAVAVMVAIVVLRIERWSVADLRRDREANREAIEELRDSLEECAERVLEANRQTQRLRRAADKDRKDCAAKLRLVEQQCTSLRIEIATLRGDKPKG